MQIKIPLHRHASGTGEQCVSVLSQIDRIHWAEPGIFALQLLVLHVQIGPLRNRHAGMAENPAKRVDIHAGHQAAMGEVVAHGMRRHGLVDLRPPKIFAEIRLIIPDAEHVLAPLHGKGVAGIASGFRPEPEPPAQLFGCPL